MIPTSPLRTTAVRAALPIQLVYTVTSLRTLCLMTLTTTRPLTPRWSTTRNVCGLRSVHAMSLPTVDITDGALELVRWYRLPGLRFILTDTPIDNYTVSNGNCGFLSRYIEPRCSQTKGGYYVCDVDCNGTSVQVASQTTSLPACPYASA